MFAFTSTRSNDLSFSKIEFLFILCNPQVLASCAMQIGCSAVRVLYEFSKRFALSLAIPKQTGSLV
jgi:hypothetical protein